MKLLAMRALTSRPIARLYAPLMRGRATIFMLHRFRDPELGIHGDEPAALRQWLQWLRRERYHLVDLEDLLVGLADQSTAWDRAVAFTIDDGYRDQARIGAPVFAEFDCPVTTFVATGFLDGALWFWWDRIEYVFRNTAKPFLAVTVGREAARYNGAGGWTAAQADFTARCKTVPEVEKLAAIERLAEAAEVALPRAAPPQYAPMTWDELRGCETRGMRFGPHTVTHPILARVPPDQSKQEILQSWERLRAEAASAVPVFCYPNGQPGDYGPREFETLQDARFVGAVVGTAGYADRRTITATPDALYQVPRYGFTETLPVLRQYVTGFERLKSLARRAT